MRRVSGPGLPGTCAPCGGVALRMRWPPARAGPRSRVEWPRPDGCRDHCESPRCLRKTDVDCSVWDPPMSGSGDEPLEAFQGAAASRCAVAPGGGAEGAVRLSRSPCGRDGTSRGASSRRPRHSACQHPRASRPSFGPSGLRGRTREEPLSGERVPGYAARERPTPSSLAVPGLPWPPTAPCP